MDAKKIAKGMHVIIANDISRTDEKHSINSNMLKMKGKRFKVDEVEKNYGEVIARIGGYMWDPHDLIEVSVKIKPKVFHFDVKELNI